MKSFETTTQINATPDKVWRVLTQTMPQDPKPFGIIKLEGSIALDAKIKLWSEVTPNRAFALKIAKLSKPQRMVWQGGMPFGLFKGTRTFTLTQTELGTTFHMQEVFTGPMSGMITKSMPDLTPSFIKFANALKTLSEAS